MRGSGAPRQNRKTLCLRNFKWISQFWHGADRRGRGEDRRVGQQCWCSLQHQSPLQAGGSGPEGLARNQPNKSFTRISTRGQPERFYMNSFRITLPPAHVASERQKLEMLYNEITNIAAHFTRQPDGWWSRPRGRLAYHNRDGGGGLLAGAAMQQHRLQGGQDYEEDIQHRQLHPVSANDSHGDREVALPRLCVPPRQMKFFPP